MEYIINDELRLRTMTMDDFPDVQRITDERYGNGYLSEDEFGDWLREPELCLCAIYKGVFGGLCYLMPESAESLAESLNFDVLEILDFADGKPLLHGKCAVLEPYLEGRGIMRVLYAKELEYASEAGYGAIYATCWKYEDVVPLKPMMEFFNFEYLGEKQNLWYDLDGYECIVCKGRCKCAADIYRKKI